MYTHKEYQIILNKLYSYKKIKRYVEYIEEDIISSIDNSLTGYLKNNDNTFENSIIKLVEDSVFQENKKWISAFEELERNIRDKNVHMTVLSYAFKNNDLRRSDKYVLYQMIKDKKKISKAIYYQIKRNIVLEFLNISVRKGLIDINERR